MPEKISIGEHMMQTQSFLTKVIDAVNDGLPALVKANQIRIERKIAKRLNQPNANEGAEDSSELDWNATTEQGFIY